MFKYKGSVFPMLDVYKRQAILYMGANKVNGGTLLSGDIIALVNYMTQILLELVDVYKRQEH